MSRRNISVSNGIVYERLDRDNWLKVPKYSRVSRTSHLDVRELTIDAKRVGAVSEKRPSI